MCEFSHTSFERLIDVDGGWLAIEGGAVVVHQAADRGNRSMSLVRRIKGEIPTREDELRKRALKTTGLMATIALVLAACAPAGTSSSTTEVPGRVGRVGQTQWPTDNRSALVQFDACDDFLDYVIEHAVELVGPYGLENQYSYGFRGGDVFLEAAATAEDSAGSDGVARNSFSGTNNQVRGVDEPDTVKTDGSRIVSLNEGRLVVTDVTGEEPRVISRLNLPSVGVQNLFLSGDTVLLFGSAWSGGPVPLAEPREDGFVPYFETPTIQIIEVDISQDAEIVRTMSIDGQYVSARMVDDTVRMVVTSGPVGFEWSYPSGSGLQAERQAIKENQEIIRDSKATNWIPYFLVSDADGEVTTEGTLFSCDRASHPEEFSGLDMLSVMTIDVGNGLDMVDATGVLAKGDTVYASADNLYVATQDWQTWRWASGIDDDGEPSTVTTDIHMFDITSDEFTTYLATGRVEGYLLNQFAMDEFDGNLRVASTTRPSWWGDSFESESMVTVLGRDGGTLEQVGIVDGLGKTEQIYSVRFLGDTAYVVTFRQTDPLYTVDLSDPSNPEVVGELKILGYSAYLHPVAEGLLLGVGQDANENGRVEGTQVSLFDVSDPADPQKIDQYTLSEGSNSQVEYDHHAFLYWEETGLAMVPVQQWWWDDDSESVFMGAVGFRVGEDDLDEIRRINHPGGDRDDWDWRAQITRSIVIGDSVYTVSSKGIMKSELDSLEESAWMGF